MFSKNLIGNVAFTYSKCIDSGSSSTYNEQSGYAIIDPYNQSFERGLCSFNVPLALRVNGVYSLPKFNHMPYKLGPLVSGWQMAPIFTRNSGLPFTIQDGTSGLAAQGNYAGFMEYERPVYMPNGPGCNSKPILGGTGPNNNYYNPECFVMPPYGTLANYSPYGQPVGRNSFEGPSTWTYDMSLQKETKLTERISMTFRADAFNLFNHPTWQIGGSSAFGGGANAISPATATYGAHYSLATLQNSASYMPAILNAAQTQVVQQPGVLCGGPPTYTAPNNQYPNGHYTTNNTGTCYGTTNVTYDGTLPRELQLSVRFTF
jgi:hypothetical protein